MYRVIAIIMMMMINQPDWTSAERNVLAVKAEVSIADWAAEHRMLTQGPIIGVEGDPVPWSNHTFPLQVAVMDAIGSDQFSRVVVMGPPQAGGKTDIQINLILHSIHHSRRDCLYVAPNQRKSADQWVKKIRPAIVASDVAWLLPEREQGGDKNRRDFVGGFSLFLAGAESLGNISSSTVPVVICDDVQAMPPRMIGAGHAVDVAAKRSSGLAEDDRTLVVMGTALREDDYLNRQLRRSTYCKPFVPCLRCGKFQLLEWERMLFDDTDPTSALDDCSIACESCNHKMRFVELQEMLRRHVWCPRGQTVSKDGRLEGDPPKTTVAGFWWNALYWPFVNWGSHAVEFIESRGDPDREMDFKQHVLTIPHEYAPEEGIMSETIIASRVLEGHRWCTVPAEADLITLFIDVHDHFLYYIARGWRKKDGRSWLIDAGTIGVHTGKGQDDPKLIVDARVNAGIRGALGDSRRMDKEGWPTCEDDGRILRRMSARAIAIDGGYRPNAVHQCCQRFNAGLSRPKWFMTLGRSSRQGHFELWPRRPRISKRTGHLYREINVDELKHICRELISIGAGEPGEWSTYFDRDLEAYHRHMVSEEFVEETGTRGKIKKWRKRKGAGPNHWWDCEVGCVALAIACGVKLVGYDVVRSKKKPRQVVSEGLKTHRGQPFMVTDR